MVRTPKMVESTVSVADNVNHCGLEIAEKSNFVPAVEKVCLPELKFTLYNIVGQI